jgi:hypothetical protein
MFAEWTKGNNYLTTVDSEMGNFNSIFCKFAGFEQNYGQPTLAGFTIYIQE